MEWETFAFGFVVGALLTLMILGALGVKVMRPFMRAASRQRKDLESMRPPINWGSDSKTSSKWPTWKEAFGGTTTDDEGRHREN